MANNKATMTRKGIKVRIPFNAVERFKNEGWFLKEKVLPVIAKSRRT
jgi:hypothetical protein